jgi:hypothetical protein
VTTRGRWSRSSSPSRTASRLPRARGATIPPGMRALAPIAFCAGCVNGFSCSNLEIDFTSATPIVASAYAPRPGELPPGTHFALYAFQNGTDSQGNPVGRLFAVATFELHHIVDLASPCFIDVGAHVPHPGLHVSQFKTVILADNGYTSGDISKPPPGATQQQMIAAATAVQRDTNVQLLAGDMGIRVVTSPSTTRYPTVAATCTVAAGQIPPPSCTDDASNALRLQLCQDTWASDPNLFEGTDRVLTQPLDGTTYGTVDGLNPVNQAPVGGAGIYVNDVLAGFDGYAIYLQSTGVPSPGTLLLFGTPTMPTRGVTHVHLTDPADATLTANMAIFANLGDNNVQF